MMKNRHDGNEKTGKLRMEELRKEFENFSYVGNETLKELIPRYCHLLTELSNYDIKIPMSELVDKFADSLPPYCNQHIEILKEKDAYQYCVDARFATSAIGLHILLCFDEFVGSKVDIKGSKVADNGRR